jgi:hypothetical protein
LESSQFRRRLRSRSRNVLPFEFQSVPPPVKSVPGLTVPSQSPPHGFQLQQNNGRQRSYRTGSFQWRGCSHHRRRARPHDHCGTRASSGSPFRVLHVSDGRCLHNAMSPVATVHPHQVLIFDHLGSPTASPGPEHGGTFPSCLTIPEAAGWFGVKPTRVAPPADATAISTNARRLTPRLACHPSARPRGTS